MVTIHHLGISQSDRVVWLMEELGLPYELKWYHRNADDNLAPPEFLALHPAATAPVIQDGDLTLVESAVILEYICRKYANGRFTVDPSQSNYNDYLYWMHFNNSFLGLFFAKMAMSGGGAPDMVSKVVARRENSAYNYLEQRLGEVPYLAGESLSCADMMVVFNLTEIPLFGGRAIDDSLPNCKAYVERIQARAAFQKAMQIAGPAAKPPGA